MKPDHVKGITSNASLAADVHQLGGRLSVLTEALPEVARYRKASYDAHVAAGFTHDQALALCHRALF